MYTLAVIHAINNRPLNLRTNFNRDSSACFARGGAVIHSGTHRSTAFIHAERHPEALQALLVWKRNQKALNGFVVALVESDDLHRANQTALNTLFKGWKLVAHKPASNPTQGNRGVSAWRQEGALRVTVSAGCLAELVAKLRRLKGGKA